MALIFFKRNKPNTKKKIFVVGTGRSGTHLLARTLGSSPEIDAHIESSRFFHLMTNAAINKNMIVNSELIKLIKDYDIFLNKSHKNIVLDKTHPNLWLVEELNSVIKNCFFIGIKRNVYATVNSMLNHKGVLKWYEKLDLDKPNHFLGITKENKDYFANLPLESKCALRWKSHHDELMKLNEQYNNLIVIDYEDFYLDIHSVLKSVNNLIGEQLDFKTEKLNKDGDRKWEKHLSESQVNNIQKIIKP